MLLLMLLLSDASDKHRACCHCAMGAVALQSRCSGTASPLQSHCKPVAAALQACCSRTASTVAVSLQNGCSIFAAPFHWYTDVCKSCQIRGICHAEPAEASLPFPIKGEESLRQTQGDKQEGKIADTLSPKYLQGVSASLQSVHSQTNNCKILADGR